MATKAAKSITINATKYELANALDVNNGKLQLKAKDVVLDEVDYSKPKYVKIIFSKSGGTHTITNIEVADGMSLNMTVSDLYNLVMQGVPVLLCYSGIASQESAMVTAIPCNHIHDDNDGTGATYATFEFVAINAQDYFVGGGGLAEMIVRYSLVAELAGTLASVIGSTYLYRKERSI